MPVRDSFTQTARGGTRARQGALPGWLALLACCVVLIGLASPARAATLTVNTLADSNVSDDSLSLREAIPLINADGDATTALGRSLSLSEASQTDFREPYGTNDTIIFTPGLTGTITMNGSQYDIEKPMAIRGPGPSSLTVDANLASPIFVMQVNGDLTIENLTIANAFDTYGSVFKNSEGSLNLANDVIKGQAGPPTIAIVTLANGTLNMNNCSITGGDAQSFPVLLQDSDGYITNTTIAGNLTAYDLIVLSALTGDRSLYLYNTTIASNPAADGVAVSASPGASSTAYYSNCIFAGNTLGNFYKYGSGGTETFNSIGGNILDDAGLTTAATDDLLNTDPKLGPLKESHGTMVLPLLADSPAIDKCVGESASPADQRNLARCDGDGNGDAQADTGAYEFQVLFNSSFANQVTLKYDGGSGDVQFMDNNTFSPAVLINKADLDGTTVFFTSDAPGAVLYVDPTFLSANLDVEYTATGGGDQFRLLGGAAVSADYEFGALNSGIIHLPETDIAFNSVEQTIEDNLSAQNRTFNYLTGGAQAITLTDAVAQADGKNSIGSELTPPVLFTAPAAGLTVQAGNGSNVSVTPDSALACALDVSGSTIEVGGLSVSGHSVRLTASFDIVGVGGGLNIAASGLILSAQNGAIGTSGHPLSFQSTTIQTLSLNDQYLNGNGPADLDTLGGLNSISGSIQLSGGVFRTQAGGGNIYGDLAVAPGVTVSGDGTIQGNVSLNGFLSPGIGGGGVLHVTGNMNFLSGSKLVAVFNGATAGGNYTQVAVDGFISIDPAAIFEHPGGAEPPDDGLIPILNNGPGGISGNFAGLPNGAALAFDGPTPYYINYGGGDGNDPALSLAPPVVYVNNGYSGANGSIINDADSNTPGAQRATVGGNAFKTIQAGISAVAVAGSVNVTDDIIVPGVYHEHLAINKSLTLRSTEALPAAVVLDGVSTGTMVTITGAASVVTLEGLTIQKGQARSGGGIMNSGILTVSNCVIQNNTANGAGATDGGGGICSPGGTVTVGGGTRILNNKATGASGAGGGIQSGGTLTLVDGVIVDFNSARKSGGGIEVKSGSFDISNSFIRNNDVNGTAGAPAPGDGGGLHIATNLTTAKLTGVVMADNIAARNGGALFNDKNFTLNVRDSHFLRNTARGAGGGAVWSEAGVITMDSPTTTTQFIDNHATGAQGAGAAVYVNGGIAALKNLYFEKNTGAQGGAVEYADASGNLTNATYLGTGNKPYELAMDATAGADNMAVTTTRFDNGAKTVVYGGMKTLAVYGLNGSDTFNVTVGADVEITVIGGAPATTPGDALVLTSPASTTCVLTSGSGGGAGSLAFTTGSQYPTLRYQGLEGMTTAYKDFGDAPATYGTLTAANGPSHPFSPLFLGSTMDSETDGRPNSVASGDDVNNTDDENGVTHTTFVFGRQATFNVMANGAGRFNAWIDYNDDGDFADAGEHVLTDRVTAFGVNQYTFSVPASALALVNTIARCRLSSATGLGTGGAAADGEVEDYAVTLIKAPAAVEDWLYYR